MTTPNAPAVAGKPTFLERMQPFLATLPAGDDKTKLQALIEAQDALERGDAHPRERVLTQQRLMKLNRPTGDPERPDRVRKPAGPHA